MNLPRPKTALIEIGGSHGECLYSQVRLMRQGGREPLIILSEELRPLVAPWGQDLEIHFFSWDRKNRIETWKTLWNLRTLLVHKGVEEVVLNTAQSDLAHKLCLLPFPSRIGFAGTLHDMGKLRVLGSQRLISRKVRHYFVLHDYLLDHPACRRFPYLHFESYYPIYFPATKRKIEKPAEEIWIAIPGRLEFSRRDYGLLLRALSPIPQPELSNLRFLILGQSNHAYGDRDRFLREAESLGCASLFRLWDEFVPDDLLHASIQASDWIMPLTPARGPQGPSPYLHRQISGAFNLAYGFRKPMLMHSDFAVHEDLRRQSLFYEEANLSSLILSIARGQVSPPRLNWPKKFTLDNQSLQYNRFLDSIRHKS